MRAILGHLRCRLRPRGVTALVATVVALALIGTPAFAGPNLRLALPAQNEEPAPPVDDTEDEVQNAVHCSRPAHGRHDERSRTETRAEFPTATSAHSHLAGASRSTSADPSGRGAGVRLRC